VKKQAKSNEIVDKIFDHVDSDHNDFIEYGEFIRACIDKPKLLTDIKFIEFAFNYFDPNNSKKYQFK